MILNKLKKERAIVLFLFFAGLALLSYKYLFKPTTITSINVSETFIDLGNIANNQEAKAKFVLTNTGSNHLIIYDILADCHCTIPYWVEKPIEPGDETVFEVEFDKSRVGFFQQNVKVYCNIENSPILLILQGKIME